MPGATRGARKGNVIILLAAVLITTVVAFAPVLHNGFVNFDDPSAIVNNTFLQSPAGLSWAWTTTHMSHYQPLSWLAWWFVTDIPPRALSFHHLSLIVHVLNAALVFLLAWQLSSAAGLDRRLQPMLATVAATVFAIHPLRVEPVAWASAFPYVLALFFALVSVVSYVASATVSQLALGRVWYATSVTSYLLSLLSRVAMPGLPFVLLILDAYPLGLLPMWNLRSRSPERDRLVGRSDLAVPLRASRAGRRRDHVEAERRQDAGRGTDASPHSQDELRPALYKSIVAKLPFFLLAIVLTIVESRSRVVAGLDEVGLGSRLTMAVSAPFVYLWHTLAPVNLTPVDPLPLDPQANWIVVAAGILAIVAVTTLSWIWRHKAPVLTAGWLGFLILLAPAIGLTPSGLQATADRYTYAPGVALAIVLAAGYTALVTRTRAVVLHVAAIGVALALVTATWTQAAYWHDSVKLWTRTVAIDPSNDIALFNLGLALEESGRVNEAIARFEETLRLIPDHEPARRSLVRLQALQLQQEADQLASAGRFEEAVARYTTCLERDPLRTRARANRGMALLQLSRFEAAIPDLEEARRNGVTESSIESGLSFALLQVGRDREAVEVLSAALNERPTDTALAHNLARLLVTSNDPTARNPALALELAKKVEADTKGQDPRALDTLAAAYALNQQLDLARDAATRAHQLALKMGDGELAKSIADRLTMLRRP